jgi:uncharacterized membrane protein
MPATNSPDILLCLREGWELFLRRPALLAGATLIAAIINLAASMIPFATLITYPLLLAGLYVMIIRLDAGESVALGNLADGLPRFVPLLVASVLISLLVTFGLMLLVLPGIYLAVAWGFTTLNIIDRGMDFWPAMEDSRRTITAHFFPYFGLVLIMLVIVTLGSLPLGLGLLVAVPVCLGAQYRFYRRLLPRDGAVELS